MRSSVDLPLPFQPSSLISFPAETSRVTSLTIHGWRSPYRFPTASSRIVGSLRDWPHRRPADPNPLA